MGHIPEPQSTAQAKARVIVNYKYCRDSDITYIDKFIQNIHLYNAPVEALNVFNIAKFPVKAAIGFETQLTEQPSGNTQN